MSRQVLRFQRELSPAQMVELIDKQLYTVGRRYTGGHGYAIIYALPTKEGERAGLLPRWSRRGLSWSLGPVPR